MLRECGHDILTRDWKDVYHYPQIAGREPGIGTDETGRIARFFLTGRSMHYIEFSGR
jgi:hypothetical protein